MEATEGMGAEGGAMAGTASPNLLDNIDSPARSSRVKTMPARPRELWLWSVCRARVLFPQSIVPA